MGVLYKLMRFTATPNFIRTQFQYDVLGDGRLNHSLDADRTSVWRMVYGIEQGLSPSDFAMDVSNLDEVANDIIGYDTATYPKWRKNEDGDDVRIDYLLGYRGGLMTYMYTFPDRNICTEVEKNKKRITAK